MQIKNPKPKTSNLLIATVWKSKCEFGCWKNFNHVTLLTIKLMEYISYFVCFVVTLISPCFVLAGTFAGCPYSWIAWGRADTERTVLCLASPCPHKWGH